jgi:hypothetical protein
MAEKCRIAAGGRLRSRRLLSLLALVETFAAPRVALGGGDCIDDEAARHRQAAMGAGAAPRAAADPVAGLDAARLYLDRLNVLATKQTRTSCFDSMADDVPKLRELYRKDESAQRDADTCALLDKVQVDLLRLAAERLVTIRRAHSSPHIAWSRRSWSTACWSLDATVRGLAITMSHTNAAAVPRGVICPDSRD